MDTTDRLGIPFLEPADPPSIHGITQAMAAALDALINPPGTLQATACPAAPAGWMLCDGAAISRITYAGLFAAIGTTYGAGDGTTTFNIPDLRGRVPLGVDGGAGRVSNQNLLGSADGDELAFLDGSSLPHAAPALVNAGNTITSATAANSGGVNVPQAALGWTNGGGQGHYNLPPYQVVNWMIKA